MLARWLGAIALATATACSGARSRQEAPPTAAPELAFEIVEGNIRNHFYRRGPIAAHLLASSGQNPRLIVAFPAGNTGIAVWFAHTVEPTDLAIDGELTGVEREDGMRGISALLDSNAPRLEVRTAVLGSIRTIRDYMIQQTTPPDTVHELVAGPPVVLRRTTVDGKHHVELVLEPVDGTTLTVANHTLVLTAAAGKRIRVRTTALHDDPPLTPLPIDRLLTAAATDDRQRDLRALAFLSYREKLLAGSWRFLTYFGRDTLLSVRLLLPVLAPDVTEAALGSVLERLSPDGDVAHEEDIGEYAALHHRKQGASGDLRAPIYDYKMVDDDFLLAPILATYLLDTEAGKARAREFLARTTSSGLTYAAALERNLALVLRRATPFAEQPSPTTLVAILPGIRVGQWRDSEEGLGNGRFPFDVNVALVPAALDAAARLYASGLLGTKDLGPVRRLAAAWQAAEAYFRVALPPNVAAARIEDYAVAHGLDPADALASIARLNGPLAFHALSLDAKGQPVPVMHTDDGFVLLFTHPSPAYLEEVAGHLLRPFPAGLLTPVGVVVANAAPATDPALRELFARTRYHGAVVWSWQQALLAVGLARQFARTDLPAATKTVLAEAQRALWAVIDATSAQRTGELWTWNVTGGDISLVPFGQQGGHADESNAVQLWSTVYLGVHRP